MYEKYKSLNYEHKTKDKFKDDIILDDELKNNEIFKNEFLKCAMDIDEDYEDIDEGIENKKSKKEKKAKRKKQTKIVDTVLVNYICLKIIPDINILESQKTFYIAKTIFSFLNEDIVKILKREDGSATKIFKENKFSFIIDMKRDDVFFYFLVPSDYLQAVKEKIYEVFPQCQLEEIKNYDLPQENEFIINENKKGLFRNKKQSNKVKTIKDTIYQALEYRYNDILSLNVEGSLSNLEELISNHNWLEEDDNIIVIYNFTALDKKEFDKKKSGYCYWIQQNQDVRQSNLLNNKLSVEYLADKVSDVLYKGLDFVTDTLTGIMGGYNEIIEEKSNKPKIDPFSVCNLFTKEKAFGQKLCNEIVVMSKSNDKKRRFQNLNCIVNSYDNLSLENELIAKDTTRPNIYKLNFGNKRNIMSLKEISKFLLLPYNSILKENESIEQVKVKQSKSMKFLEKGIFNLGIHKFRDIVKNIFLPGDYNSESLAYVPIAPQGSGKTTFLVNLIVNAMKALQSNVIIDYIKNCELSTKVMEHTKDVKPVIIDAEDISKLISMEFNEYDVPDDAPINQLASSIDFKAEATENIINALNDITLTANMSNIIYSACRIVYTKSGRGIGDFIEFLINHEYRSELINEVKDKDYKNLVFNKQMKEALNVIEQLNEYTTEKDDDGFKYKVLTGTNFNKINGIMARINRIKKSFLLSNMLYDCPKMNFVDLLNEGKTIIVKLPEHIVSADEKNVISTFITMKTILATIKRGGQSEQPLRTNLWIDEVYQVPTVENVIYKYLSQLRKYGLKIVLTVHRLSQLNNKKFQAELLGSGASFSLLAGCKDIQIKDFEDRLKDFNYEDIYNLEPYTALHLIHSVKDGDWTGVTQLPPALK